MKKILILSFVMLAAIACDQKTYFDLERPPQFPWNSMAELEMAAIEPYRAIGNNAWGDPMGEFNLYMYTTSDISQLIPGTSGNLYWYEYYNRLYRTTASAGRLNDVWTICYNTITSCNIAIDFITGKEDAKELVVPGMTTADYDNQVKRIKGELYFMRAFAYYHLVRFFCPPYVAGGTNTGKFITLRTKFTEDPASIQNSYLGTVEEVYQQILKDLLAAKDLLPNKYIAGVHNASYKSGRANKFVASGMLARLYFLMGDYTKAETECTFIIDQGGYSIEGISPMDAFSRNAGMTDCPEIIWEMVSNRNADFGEKIATTINKSHYTAMNGGRGTSWSRCGWDQFTLSYYALKKIGWMTDPANGNYNETAEAKKDLRYHSVTNPDDAVTSQRGYWYRLEPFVDETASGVDHTTWLNKYETQYRSVPAAQVWCDKYYRAPDGRYANIPFMRLPEFLLTRSVLKFLKNDKAGAVVDLNRVRNRAGLSSITAANLTRDDIDNERIKELGAEAGDWVTYKISLKEPIGLGDRKSDVKLITPPYADFFWNVPIIESDLNSAYK